MTGIIPRLVHTSLGDTVSYRNRFLYSRHDPKKRPEDIARSLDILPNTLVLVPSPLLLYGVDTLLEKLPDSCDVLCVETDQQLMAFSLKHAPAGLLENSRIHTVRTENPAALLSYIERVGVHKFRRVVSIALSGGYQLNRTIYDQLAAATERHIQRYWQNRITLLHMGRLWIKNIIANLSQNRNNLVSQLPATRKPVVVAGAGESLEQALNTLKMYRDRFFLLAVDTALPVLYSSGIEPDAVVVLESQLVNAGDFIGHGNRELRLICDLTAHPSTLRAVKGEKHFVISAFYPNHFLSRLQATGLHIPFIRPMGSVGVVAVELARMISTAPVILTGLDFSYTPGKPHSRGAPSHVLSLASSSRTRPVGWFGESVRRPLIVVNGSRGRAVTTDIVLNSYAKDLDESIKSDHSIYDLMRDGVALSSIPLRTEREFEQVLISGESERPFMPEGEPDGCKTISDLGSSLQSFLENEHDLLDNFLRLCAHYRDRREDEAFRSRVSSALTQVDYVCIDFPDAHRIDDANDEFFLRAAASAADFRRIVRNAIDTF